MATFPVVSADDPAGRPRGRPAGSRNRPRRFHAVELKAMSDAFRILEPLDEPSRQRALAWLKAALLKEE
jgi:hypothetical protein